MPRIFCLAKSCYNYQPSSRSPAFFNLPSDLQSRLKWIENSGRLDLKEKTVSNLSGKYYICADHFESHCFIDPLERLVLRRDPDVVPTVFKKNLPSLVSMDSRKTFRDSHSTLAGTILAEVESAQDIVHAEWPKIVVSLGSDENLISDTSQELPESSKGFATEDDPQLEGMVLELAMMCRLCAAVVQISMLVPVFGEEADTELQNMIDRIIPGKVLMNDGFPQRVCTICVERIKSCCETLDLFKAADSHIRQMFGNIDETNIEHDGSFALQDANSIPIILQAVHEELGSGLDDISSSINQDFTQEQSPLQACVADTITLNLEQIKEADHPNIAVTDAMNFSVQTEGDSLNFEEAQQIKCGLCQEIFANQGDLVSHCTSYHSIKLQDTVFTPEEESSVFQCTSCDDVLSTGNCLKNHLFSHDLEIYECALCKLIFKYKSELSDHFCQEHNNDFVHNIGTEDSIKCDLCEKVFKNPVALRKHKATHTGERTVLCSLCGKTLANLNSLRVHMRIHSEERPFTCNECGKSFKGSSEVRAHSLTHSREKKYECPECGRKFHSKGLVRQHMLSHTHEKPHKCNMCTASFNRLGNLNQHKKKHVDSSALPLATPFECNTCGKRFESKLTLKYHVGKHTGEKYPFDCEICGKKFIAIDPFRVHMRVHTGERPYECKMCKKTFRSSGTLKQHTASLHVDDFPYACTYCQRSFKRLQSLIVHKKTHTGEKPWPCSQCGRAFAQKGDMIKHTKTHRPHIEEEEIIMEVDTIDDLALDNEIIDKMIFG